MRGLFNQPRPRHFSHRFQFIDERKEQLRLLREEMSKDGVRKTEDKVSDRQERLHMLFAEAARQRRAKRRSTTTAAWLWGAITAIAAAAVLLLLGAWG